MPSTTNKSNRPTSSAKVSKKSIWQTEHTTMMKQFAQQFGGTYVAASFKNWKYTAEHVKLPVKGIQEPIYISLKSSGNSGNGSKNMLILQIKYIFRPRRKLEFMLKSIKRLLMAAFYRNMREVAMPDSTLRKYVKGIATHPSTLRSVLKYDGLPEALVMHPAAAIQLRVKEGKATLRLDEAEKEWNLSLMNERVELMKMFIHSLRGQNIVHEDWK